MDKIFRRTKFFVWQKWRNFPMVTKILSNEKFCPTKILSNIVLSDKVLCLSTKKVAKGLFEILKIKVHILIENLLTPAKDIFLQFTIADIKPYTATEPAPCVSKTKAKLRSTQTPFHSNSLHSFQCSSFTPPGNVRKR